MQNIEPTTSAPISESALGQYSVRQRMMSASLSLVMTGSASAMYSSAMAFESGAWGQAHQGAAAGVPASAAAAATAVAPTRSPVANTSFGIMHSALQAAAQHSAANSGTLSPAWHAARAAMQEIRNQQASAHDINLSSAAALYNASGLAGFHDLAIDIGGKQMQVTGDTRLTGAQLVAVQQVLADGGQDIRLNARGVATGGVFEMSAATIGAITDAIGGDIKSLYISRGVQAIDSLANLNLVGNLVNMGSLVVGAGAGATHTVDNISAANIYNGWGSTITSMASVLTPTDISLTASGLFFNAGTVYSAGNLNITASTITNVYAGSGAVPNASTLPVISAAQNVNLITSSIVNNGMINSTYGNVNVVTPSTGSVNFNNVGGTVQALNGNINFNTPDYYGNAALFAGGGNWLSQQLNFYAGSGTINANVNQVTGQINGSGTVSHITTNTDVMNLGTICIDGDPTYYNTGGDIVISSALTTNGADLALVASGNIFANGGSLDTSSGAGNGGALTIIAGADFTTSPSNPGNKVNDSTTTVTISGGNATGGYIDLSGVFLTGSTTNKAVTDITTNSAAGKGGDVLMVAFKGTGTNSGSVIASAIPGEAGATSVTALGTTSNGNITIIGNGAALFGQNLYGGDINIQGGIPFISGGTGKVAILDGTIVPGSGAFVAAAPSQSDINFLTVVGHDITMKTNGFISSDVIVASGVGGGVNSKGGDSGNVTLSGSSLFLSGVDATGGGGGGGNPGQAGGAGGNGGNITLTATTGPIIIEDFSPAPGFLNVSGGGGGGGGGGVDGGAGGAGGAGGKAGTVTVNAGTFFFSGGVLAADGGAGGAGGAGIAGTAGGGGGGGGGSFGGGGGGGAAGSDSTGTKSAAGGGGGAGFYRGGGGGAGSTGNAVVTAGTGGSSTGASGPVPGTGGTVTSGTGVIGASGDTTGNGGNGGVPAGLTGGKGGQNGGFPTAGAGGGSDANAGLIGGEMTTKNGSGVVNITTTSSLGTPAAPFNVSTAKLNVTTKAANTNAFVSSFGDGLELTGATIGTGGTLSLISGGSLQVSGDITGAKQVSLFSNGLMDISNAKITASTGINLQAFNSDSKIQDGAISSAGLSLLTAPTISLIAEDSITANVATSKLTAQSGGLSVTINAAATSTKVLTLLGANVASGGTFDLTSAQQINVTKGIVALNGIVNLTETGTLSPIGINITSPISVVAPLTGTKGTINLKTTGNGSIVNSSVLNAFDLTITAGGAVGSASKPLATNVLTNLTVNGKSGALIAIKDANTGTLNVTGTSTVFGQTLNLTSAASTLNIVDLPFTNVTLNDTFATAGKGAAININPAAVAGKQIGDGFGTVSITTNQALINQGAIAAPVIYAKNLVLKSTASSIGTTGSGLLVSASNLTGSAVKGSLKVVSDKALTVNAGSALTNYNVKGSSLTVAGVISGATIDLLSTTGGIVLNANVGSTKSTVNIQGETGIAQNAKAVLSGLNVNLKANTSGDIGSTGQSILTKATNLTVNGPNAMDAYVKQTGAVNLGNGLAAGNSTLNLVSTGNISVTGSNSFGRITLSGPVVSVTSTGALGTINGLAVVSPSFKNAGNVIATGGATFTNAGALSLTGNALAGLSGVLTLGGGANGKPTTSITLGDAKTGANSPLSGWLDSKLDNIFVNTTGAFTGSIQKIASDSSTFGGTVSITASKLVNVNAVPSLAPIVIAANSTVGGSGSVSLHLTGTQTVTLGSKTPLSGDPQITMQSTGGTGNGVVEVVVAGILNVETGGVVQTGSASALTLSGAKGLSVRDAGLLNTNLGNLTLTSGSTKAFTIGEGATPVNGTAGNIQAVDVNINVGSSLVMAAGATSKATNSTEINNKTGALTILGADDSITPGVDLTLTAKTGITLGDAKNLGVNNPLASFGSGILTSLVISTGGNLTGAFDTIALKATGGLLSLTAGNIVDVGSTPLAPIQLKADGGAGPAGIVDVNITGTQAVVVGNGAVAKGMPQLQISANGASGGIVEVTASGALTVNNGGITYGGGTHELTLGGAKGLSVNDVTLLNTNLSTVNLTGGSTTPFVVGVASPVANGVQGSIQAGAVTVTGLKGITVNPGASIIADGNGQGVTIDTSNLVNNGTIGGKNTASSLVFFDSGKNNLGVSSTGTGVYQNFGSVSFSTGGNVALGNLLTTAATLKGINTIGIAAGGSVTFDATAPTYSVANGTIYITAGSLVTKAATPVTFNGTGTSAINVTTKSALTYGTTKGTVSVSNAAGTIDLKSSGTLTINSALTAVGANLTGSSVVINNVVTGGSGTLSVLANGATGTITTKGTGVLVSNGGVLYLGQGNAKLGATAIQIKADSLGLGLIGGQGALNINNANTTASNVDLNTTIAALNYTLAGDVSITNISTTAGGITVSTAKSLSTVNGTNISTVGGGINLIAGSAAGNKITLDQNNTLTASSGSVLIQNNNTTDGTITIGSGVNILGSGTAKGVGQVSIVIGALPAATQLVTGVVPMNVTLKATDGAGVFFGTLTNQNGTITANGSNILFAEGRNVVFDNKGLGAGAITINGGTITADPPAGAGLFANTSAASSMTSNTGADYTFVRSAGAPTISAGSSVLQASTPIAVLPALTAAIAASAERSAQMPGCLQFGNGLGGSNAGVTDYRAGGTGSGSIGTSRLERGAVLLSPEKDTVVQTAFGPVSATAGSLALIVAFEHGLAVYNLHDVKKDAVSVVCGNRQVSIAPGRSTLLTDREVKGFEEINPAHFVAYRGVRKAEYGSGVKAFHSEFNLYTLMRGVDAIKKLVNSEDPKARKIASSMLKTAAILMQLGNTNKYELMLPAQMTAMLANNAKH